MSVTYKDIDQLTQKVTVAGTEKLPVSDTEFITPNQIAAGNYSLQTKFTDAEILGSNIFNKETMADKQPGYFLGTNGELAIDANSAVSGRIPIKENTEYVYHDFASGTAYLCFYDANGTALTPLRANGVPYDRKYLLPSEIFITPAGTQYVLVTTKFAGTSYADDISIYEGQTEQGYLVYEKRLLYSQLPSKLLSDIGAMETQISGAEASSNKVTSLSSSSTDTQYPSAKCVYDIIGDVETLINAL